MIVVDTNIIAYLYLPSQFTEQTNTFLQQNPSWAVPFIWQSEFRNVLGTFMKKGIITYTESLDIYDAAHKLLKGNEFSINTEKVLYMTKESGCSAYDCEFVCLAQELQVPLITLDKKVLHRFPETAKTLPEFIVEK